MKVTLSLTHNCNLACRYCYAGRKIRRNMTPETAFKVVDFALEQAGDGRPVQINFFGGEPFLCLDLMWGVADYARRCAIQRDKDVSFGVTTNGTLLDSVVLRFLSDHKVDLCISLDGPAPVHNRHRVYADGKGSFDKVVRNLERALAELPSVQVNAVYGPHTLPMLSEVLDLFIHLEVPAVHLNPDITARWEPDAIAGLAPAFEKVADRYIDCYRSGRELAVNAIDGKIILFMKGGYQPEDCCGMGETEFGVAPSGNIYACERFIGQDDDFRFLLGNIHHGVDLKNRCRIASMRGNQNPECPHCHFRPYCMNWCGCTNFHMTGFSNWAGAALCAGERAAIEAAKRVFTTLAGNDLFIDHLMHYLQKERCAKENGMKEV